MNNKKPAFTLIELLVTIVIIGILSTISVATFNEAQEKARVAKALSNVSLMERRMKESFQNFAIHWQFNQNDEANSFFNLSRGANSFTLSGGDQAVSELSDDAPNPGTSFNYTDTARWIRSTSQIDSFDIVDNYTLSFWFKMDPDGCTTGSCTIHFDMRGGSSFQILEVRPTYSSVNAGESFHNTSATVNDGKWHHMLVSVNDTTIFKYLDGKLLAELTRTGLPTSGTLSSFLIDLRPEASNYMKIDDVIYLNAFTDFSDLDLGNH